MALTLNAARIACLIAFVDRRVRRNGCDHTHRFSHEWADEEAVDWHDLLDILEANGGFCDCEVAMNLPDDTDLHSPAAAPSPPANRWLLLPDFACDPGKVFKKVIVCQADLARNTYAKDGEIVVPAPKGAKARRRVRKSTHFFVGCESGLPTEVGVVRDCEEISAQGFADKVAASGFEELADFTFREAGFVLARIAFLQAGAAVGTDFADRVGVASRHVELTVHRVIVTR